MPKNIVLAVLRALVVTALVLVGFFTLVTTTQINRTARMQSLSVTSPNVTGIKQKAVTSTAADPSQSPLAEVKSSVKAHPSLTGTYSSIWNGESSTKEQSVIVNVDLLPTAESATIVAQQISLNFVDQKALKSYSKVVHFTVPNLPGGVLEADFYANATTDSPNTVSTVVDMHVGRFVVLAVGGGAVTLPRQQIIDLAIRQYQLIKNVPADYSLAVKTHPVGFSILYFLIGIALIIFAFDGVHWMAMAKEQRAARQEALTRYHYQSRGSKQLKRRAKPSGRR